jgi:lysophospholipase L1-like esterase
MLAAGTLLGLAIGEAALRLLDIHRPYFYQYDDRRGWALKPGAEGWQDGEGKAWIHVNSAGYRDRERSVEKTPGTYRIAIVGDSYSDAYQVPLESTYWSELERTLNQRMTDTGRNVEVLNFGVRGYGTAQELLTFQQDVRSYNPDLVLLQITTENDIVENSPVLNTKAANCPFYRIDQGRLTLDLSFADARALGIRMGDWYRAYLGLRDRLRIAEVIDLDAIYDKFIEFKRSRERKRKGEESDLLGGLVTFTASYVRPDAPELASAWEVTQLLLLEMKTAVAETGASFAIVTLSNPIQVFPDAAVRKRFMDSISIDDLFYADNRIRKFCADHDVPVITLAPRLQQIADRDGVFLHGFANTPPGDGHWNESAHAIAGQIIANEILKWWQSVPANQGTKTDADRPPQSNAAPGP